MTPPPSSNHPGLVQKQTRKVEEAKTVFVGGIRELSEMEQIEQNVGRESRGEQKRRGLGQLIMTGTRHAGSDATPVAMLHSCTYLQSIIDTVSTIYT